MRDWKANQNLSASGWVVQHKFPMLGRFVCRATNVMIFMSWCWLEFLEKILQISRWRSGPGYKYFIWHFISVFSVYTHDFRWICCLQSRHAPGNKPPASARVGRVSLSAHRVTEGIKCFVNSFQQSLLNLAPTSPPFPGMRGVPSAWDSATQPCALGYFLTSPMNSFEFKFLPLAKSLTAHSSDFQFPKSDCFTFSLILPNLTGLYI